LILHCATPVKERQRVVERFQQGAGPPFFILSLKAGGTGLNLTAASHVIHFDRWWNPAVENQATDRAFRIGQKKNVLVHKFVCRGTVEEWINGLLEKKSLPRASRAERKPPLRFQTTTARFVALDSEECQQEGLRDRFYEMMGRGFP
jgi:hypothetical protein